MNGFLKSLRTRLEARRQRHAEMRSYLKSAQPPEPVVTGTGRDYSVMSENDRALKVHLPEAAHVALSELCEKHDSNFSTLIRHVLFIYLYGRYDLIALLERGKGQFDITDRASGHFMRVSNADNRTSDLGKNDHDIKTWIPSQMHADLKQAADNKGIPLSVFVREVIITYLFGHQALPERESAGDGEA